MMKEQILQLKSEGKTFTEILKITGASKGTLHYHLSPKGKENSRRRRQRNCRSNMTKLKMSSGGKCNKCQYDRCLDALDFHHLDPKTKDHTYHSISAILRSCSIQKAQEEVAKCVLLCANCHREIHSTLDTRG